MANVYESDAYLADYLLFHYGTARDVWPCGWALTTEEVLNFPARCVALADLDGGTRALDVGCAVGRATFELTRQFDEVVGIDFSQRFIEAAQRLRQTGVLNFQRVEEGKRTSPCQALVPPELPRENATFEVGDAMALRNDLGSFDLVLAANLLCRLPEPARFLGQLPALVRPGGSLVLTTPCTWLEEFTPREHWLCDERTTTLEGLRQWLEPEFTLVRTRELPFLLRETARKFQLTIAQGSCWQRR
jgi:putative 4-mercaptohistidine N1-methyltranferase